MISNTDTRYAVCVFTLIHNCGELFWWFACVTKIWCTNINIKCTNHPKKIICIEVKAIYFFHPCNIKTFIITSSNWIPSWLDYRRLWNGSTLPKAVVNREMFGTVMVHRSGNSALASLHMMILKSTGSP